MSACRGAFLVLALGLCVAPGEAEARVLPTSFQDQLVVGNLSEPTGLAFLPDGRLLVIERPGRVRLVVNGKLGVMDPLLEPDSVDASGPESGLLGVAVDPDWPLRPYVYLHGTRMGGTQRVTRYRASGDLSDGSSVFLTIDPASAYLILSDIPDQDPGRNGGALCFGPDGALYVGIGDDGVECAAQDTTSLRGVVLRLAVSGLPDGPGGPPSKSQITPADNPWSAHPDPNARLAWAIGLRDPFRMRTDPRDGRLFVGDVGSSLFEEVDEVAAGGLDLGWPHYEGPQALAPPCPDVDSTQLTGPIAAYPDTAPAGAARVIGGGIYLGAGCPGCDFPAGYAGDYFLADAHFGFLRRLKRTGGIWNLAAAAPGQPSAENWGSGFDAIQDLMVGPDGALWYCLSGNGGANGEVGRIAYVAPALSVEAPPGRTFSFAPPAPSPMRETVELAYEIRRRSRVEMAVYDAGGRRVRHLLAGSIEEPGRHALSWDGRSESGVLLPAGIYIARLSVDGETLARMIPRVR